MDWTTKLRHMSLICLILIISLTSAYAAVPCALRKVNSDHFVCVCNATYCDTLEADIEVPRGKYVLYTTAKEGLAFFKSSGELTQDEERPDVTGFYLDPSATHQAVLGFGTSFSDSAGQNCLSLSAPTQDNLLSSYFSPRGIEMTMGRVPIGGTDFSPRPYSYDDVEGDNDLSEFQLQPEDLTYKIPIIKRAIKMSRKSIKLSSAAWSSPAWMKTHNSLTGFGFLKHEYYQLWADYHIKFLEAYKKHDVDFWSISTGNEPTIGIIPIVVINALGWSPQAHAKWLAENLGPTIKNSKFKDLKIVTMDDQRLNLPWWMNMMFQNEEAKNYTDGIGVHWYWDSLIPPSVLTATHDNFPDKFIIGTEASRVTTVDKPVIMFGAWSRAEAYMKDIIQDMNNWVSGWIDWNFAIDMQGGPNWAKNYVDAAVLVNKDADEFYKQPMFYALGHFAKFIPEGSVHISVKPQSQDGVQTTAFITPNGDVAMVLYNKESIEKTISVNHPEKGYATFYIPKNSFSTLLL